MAGHKSLALGVRTVSLAGKNGLIMGIANTRSIAAAIGKCASFEGASLACSYLPDQSGKSHTRVQQAVSDWATPPHLFPCDVNDDSQLDEFFSKVAKIFPKLDFLIHSIAFAPIEDIRCPTAEASRAGFLTAMETSVYSLLAVVRRATPLFNEGASVLTLSYFGAQKVVPGYNLMGVAKAALEASVRYLAFDLGGGQVRVNALSAGPIKTLASSAIGNLSAMLEVAAKASPLARNVRTAEVAKTACFLVGDGASAITGEILHVDAGYHAMAPGSPPHASPQTMRKLKDDSLPH